MESKRSAQFPLHLHSLLHKKDDSFCSTLFPPYCFILSFLLFCYFVPFTFLIWAGWPHTKPLCMGYAKVFWLTVRASRGKGEPGACVQLQGEMTTRTSYWHRPSACWTYRGEDKRARNKKGAYEYRACKKTGSGEHWPKLGVQSCDAQQNTPRWSPSHGVRQSMNWAAPTSTNSSLLFSGSCGLLLLWFCWTN